MADTSEGHGDAFQIATSSKEGLSNQWANGRVPVGQSYQERYLKHAPRGGREACPGGRKTFVGRWLLLTLEGSLHAIGDGKKKCFRLSEEEKIEPDSIRGKGLLREDAVVGGGNQVEKRKQPLCGRVFTEGASIDRGGESVGWKTLFQQRGGIGQGGRCDGSKKGELGRVSFT